VVPAFTTYLAIDVVHADTTEELDTESYWSVSAETTRRCHGLIAAA